jgi:ribose transport system substrate-binding protein
MIGRVAALRISQVLQGKDEVAVVGIDPQSLSSLTILRSFVSVLEESFPKIAIVDRRASAGSNFGRGTVSCLILS